MNYRFDKRSKEQFIKDIEEASRIERQLLERWLIWLEKEYGQKFNYCNTGCGNDGQYLEQKDVNCKADFEVDKFGLVEVKFSKTWADPFHLKVQQIQKYAEQDACILFVNGSETATPKFTFIEPKKLMKKKKIKVVKCWHFGGKEAYRIPTNRYEWEKL